MQSELMTVDASAETVAALARVRITDDDMPGSPPDGFELVRAEAEGAAASENGPKVRDLMGADEWSEMVRDATIGAAEFTGIRSVAMDAKADRALHILHKWASKHAPWIVERQAGWLADVATVVVFAVPYGAGIKAELVVARDQARAAKAAQRAAHGGDQAAAAQMHGEWVQ